VDRDDPVRFGNLRAFTYWLLRRRLEDGDLALPADPILWEELLNTTYEYKDGKLFITDKKVIKRRIGRSPDRADALMLTFAGEAYVPEGVGISGAVYTGPM
jgi:hypothetical protein